MAVEPIRDRAVKQRDESNARIAKVNVACKTALGKLDLSELLRRESEAAAKTPPKTIVASRKRRFMHQRARSVPRRRSACFGLPPEELG